MKILLTGGAGYIGSHTYLALVEAGFTPVIVDDFSNSHPAVIDRLQQLTGNRVLVREGTVADFNLTSRLIEQNGIETVIHFAAHKAVGESVADPLKYYDNNLRGLVRLLQAMNTTGCRRLVFSSSATVYGDASGAPISEDAPRTHTNPYGHTKLICEDMLRAVRASNPLWRVGILRYFNPVGAHPSGLIGEDPNGTPSNLMPLVAQVAVGKRPYLSVYGDDYPTPDGTGVRDYIHVQDLARGHVAALQALLGQDQSFTVNLGTGRGHSVLEVVRTFEAASGRPIPFQFAPRRPGDVAQCYADPRQAWSRLGWRALRSLRDMCADTWRWQSRNPEGYARATISAPQATPRRTETTEQQHVAIQ